MRISQLSGLFDGNARGGGSAPDLRTVEIRGEREEPGGKSGVLAPLTKRAKGPQECLLGHVFGTALIATEAIRQVNERNMPAAHNSLKRIGIAGKDSFHIDLVLTGGR